MCLESRNNEPVGHFGGSGKKKGVEIMKFVWLLGPCTTAVFDILDFDQSCKTVISKFETSC